MTARRGGQAGSGGRVHAARGCEPSQKREGHCSWTPLTCGLHEEWVGARPDGARNRCVSAEELSY
eukprot:117897-Prymnesium_polylepis.1